MLLKNVDTSGTSLYGTFRGKEKKEQEATRITAKTFCVKLTYI